MLSEDADPTATMFVPRHRAGVSDDWLAAVGVLQLEPRLIRFELTALEQLLLQRPTNRCGVALPTPDHFAGRVTFDLRHLKKREVPGRG